MASLSGFGSAVIAAVERSPLFRSAAPDTFDALIERARLRRRRPGRALTHQGVDDDHVHLVVAGRLKRYRLSIDGREIILDLPGPGDVVGLVPVLDGRSPCHGTTSLATTDLLEIPGSVVRTCFQNDPGFAVSVTRALIDTLRLREREIVQMATEDARTRLTERLLDLAESGTDEADGLVVGLSQEELASWAGISRESAAKALQNLRARSIVRTGRRRIVIDDLDALREVVEGARPTPPHEDHRSHAPTPRAMGAWSNEARLTG